MNNKAVVNGRPLAFAEEVYRDRILTKLGEIQNIITKEQERVNLITSSSKYTEEYKLQKIQHSKVRINRLAAVAEELMQSIRLQAAQVKEKYQLNGRIVALRASMAHLQDRVHSEKIGRFFEEK
jgi:hypothetical protein